MQFQTDVRKHFKKTEKHIKNTFFDELCILLRIKILLKPR